MAAPFRPSDDEIPPPAAAGLPYRAPRVESSLLRLFRERDAAVALVLRFVADHDEERFVPDQGCLECTLGTTPKRLETGPCAHHAAVAFLAKFDRRS
jgi:hypothetical protein